MGKYKTKPSHISPLQNENLPQSTLNLLFANARFYYDRASEVKDNAGFYIACGSTVLETISVITGKDIMEVTKLYNNNPYGGKKEAKKGACM